MYNRFLVLLIAGVCCATYTDVDISKQQKHLPECGNYTNEDHFMVCFPCGECPCGDNAECVILANMTTMSSFPFCTYMPAGRKKKLKCAMFKCQCKTGFVLAGVSVPTGSPTTPPPTPSLVMPIDSGLNISGCEEYAVHAGTTVTFAGAMTFLIGNVGVSPGTAVTGTWNGGNSILNNTADLICAAAKTIIYNSLSVLPCNQTIASDMTGMTLTPGVYCATTLTLSAGSLTLDAEGDPDAQFIFQASTTLITASNTGFNLINGATADNVFWMVGSSATLGTYSSFTGHVVAVASITVNPYVSITGHLLAGAAVTFAGGTTFTLPSTSSPTQAPTTENSPDKPLCVPIQP
jgi:hypothetical protein